MKKNLRKAWEFLERKVNILLNRYLTQLNTINSLNTTRPINSDYITYVHEIKLYRSEKLNFALYESSLKHNSII